MLIRARREQRPCKSLYSVNQVLEIRAISEITTEICFGERGNNILSLNEKAWRFGHVSSATAV